MMEIYLTHKIHGKKIAHAFQESELDKLSGWRQVTKEEFYNKPETSKVVTRSVETPPVQEKKENSQDPSLVEAYKEKFGKAPHHRMSNDTIKNKLEHIGDKTAA